MEAAVVEEFKSRICNLEDELRRSREENDRLVGECVWYTCSKKLMNVSQEEDKEKETLRKALEDLQLSYNEVEERNVLLEAQVLECRSKHNDQNTSSLRQVHCEEPLPSRAGRRKKKRVQKTDKKDEAALKLTCDNLLKHFNGEHVLTADKNGTVDIGEDVQVNLEAFQKCVVNEKVGEVKKTQKIVGLVWTASERLNRSLRGLKSNRHSTMPAKAPASPKKVSAILGSIKACLLHAGYEDGPVVDEKINTCRKAIGKKLADDGYNCKRPPV